MHGDGYDFSELYGGPVYGSRTLTYNFDFIYESKLSYHANKLLISDWLMENTSDKLFDDLLPGYYFIVDCEASPQFNEQSLIDCDLSVTFKAEPFMYGEYYEGSDIWDIFCFLTDYTQCNTFKIEGTKEISMYNISPVSVTPEIHCSSSMKIVKEDIEYSFNTGVSTDYKFQMKRGENKMIVNGYGILEILFRRQML